MNNSDTGKQSATINNRYMIIKGKIITSQNSIIFYLLLNE